VDAFGEVHEVAAMPVVPDLMADDVVEGGTEEAELTELLGYLSKKGWFGRYFGLTFDLERFDLYDLALGLLSWRLTQLSRPQLHRL
jgi:hypothetical protein